MINTALDYLRRIKASRFDVDITEIEYKVEGKQEIIEKMQADDLLSIIRTLPKGYRTVFNLYAIEGYSHKEIAK